MRNFSRFILESARSVFIAATIVLAGCGGGASDDAGNGIAPALTIAYSQSGSDGLNPEVTLTGTLPSTLAKKPLLDTIRGCFPYPIKVVDNVQQKTNIATPAWYPLLQGAIPGLFSQTSSLTMAFNDRALDVEGVSDTVEQKEAVAKASVLAFSKTIDYVNHRLRVERVKPRPSHVSIMMDETGTVELRGLVNDTAIKTSIEAVLGTETWHGANVRISNEIEIRPFAAAPKWAGELQSFLPLYFDTPQERSLFINSDSVRLGGKVRSEQEKRTLVYAAGRAFLDSDLPVADTLVTNRLTQQQRRGVLSRQSLSDFVSRIHIYFESGHHIPSTEEQRKLQAVAAKLSTIETDEKLMIIGLSDDKGDAETNRWLMDERCKSVLDALLDMGCDKSRLVLEPNAQGKARPNETAEQLRRVEFHVISPGTVEG